MLDNNAESQEHVTYSDKQKDAIISQCLHLVAQTRWDSDGQDTARTLLQFLIDNLAVDYAYIAELNDTLTTATTLVFLDQMRMMRILRTI